jgi:hypothetical protein
LIIYITKQIEVFSCMLGKNKKYQINFNGAYYNARTGEYETRDGRNMSFAEASKDKWKCEKCSETFPTFKMLMDHKNQVHSY